MIVLFNTNTARLNERLDYLANAVSQLTSEVFKLTRATETLGGEVAELKDRLHQADSVQVQSQRPSEHATEPSAAKCTSSTMQEGSRKRNRTSPAELPESRETYPRGSGSISMPAAWDSSAALWTPQSEKIHDVGDRFPSRPVIRGTTSAIATPKSLITHVPGHGYSTIEPGTNEASAAPETPQSDGSCINNQDVVSEPGAAHPSDATEMVGSRQTSKAPFVWPEPLSEPEFGPFGEPAGSFTLEDWPVAASKPLMTPPSMLLPSVVYRKPVVEHRPSLFVKLRLSAAVAQRLTFD